MRSLFTLPALLCTGCVTAAGRAHFTLVSADGVPPVYEIVSPRVTGQACATTGEVLNPLGLAQRSFLEMAVEDALQKAPGAGGLASFEIVVRDTCYEVSGAALKLTP